MIGTLACAQGSSEAAIKLGGKPARPPRLPDVAQPPRARGWRGVDLLASLMHPIQWLRARAIALPWRRDNWTIGTATALKHHLRQRRGARSKRKACRRGRTRWARGSKGSQQWA